MTIGKSVILAGAIAALTAMGAASAQAPDGRAENCQAAVARGMHALDCREGVILASYVPPRERGERVLQADEQVPEPGNWARLMAVLLGAISIARRRMS